jgi:hypothetical protein
MCGKVGSAVVEREMDPDRAVILARRRRFASLVLGGLSTGCQPFPCLSLRNVELGPGGMYLCEDAPVERGCEGCTELERRDLVQAVDGVAVADPDELDRLIGDGQPHAVQVFDQDQQQLETVELHRAADAPPLCSVPAHDLDKAPIWARRSFFGRRAPALPLIDDEGRSLDTNDLHGRRYLIVAFDWATSTDRQDAALMLQVLQKAQADLRAEGVEFLFAQVPHPSNSKIRPMNRSKLRGFAVDNQLTEREGGPLPLPPLYHSPTLGRAHSDLERFGEPPNVWIVDERGVVRWHSAGVTPDPFGEIVVDAVYTINAAVIFARDSL